jgi:hypothetical protein
MYSRRNTFILIAAAVLVALVVGYISYMVHRAEPASTEMTQTTDNTPVTALLYTSDTYGIAFNYPSSYALTQKDVRADTANKIVAHHNITLTNTSAQTPNNGEGPTAITLDIYPNPKNGLIQDWIKNTDASNYKLAVDSNMQNAMIGGTAAYAYTWSGLYYGNNFVFSHKNYIIMASVTYLTTGDAILNDFTQIMSTLKLR